MRRVDVSIKRSALVPAGYAAWVPRKRRILIARGATLTERLLAHELKHVTQAERHPWPWAYLTQWARTGFSYTNMPFEIDARAAERDPQYLAWARDLMQALWAAGELDDDR
jgi:hypothetical protein